MVTLLALSAGELLGLGVIAYIVVIFLILGVGALMRDSDAQQSEILREERRRRDELDELAAHRRRHNRR